MKKITTWVILTLCYVLGTTQLVAQDEMSGVNKKTLNVQKYTVMEQYEPELILSVNERIRWKKERLATIKRRRRILDTLDISNRRRQRLLKELHDNPFSDKLNRAVADIEFTEDEVDE